MYLKWKFRKPYSIPRKMTSIRWCYVGLMRTPTRLKVSVRLDLSWFSESFACDVQVCKKLIVKFWLEILRKGGFAKTWSEPLVEKPYK